jgi:hypothetical protein
MSLLFRNLPVRDGPKLDNSMTETQEFKGRALHIRYSREVFALVILGTGYSMFPRLRIQALGYHRPLKRALRSTHSVSEILLHTSWCSYQFEPEALRPIVWVEETNLPIRLPNQVMCTLRRHQIRDDRPTQGKYRAYWPEKFLEGIFIEATKPM